VRLNVLLLPGDGIGPEVTAQALRVLEAVTGPAHDLHVREATIGGAAIERSGAPLPDATRALALDADAVLLGAVGLPRFDDHPPALRPERGLLDLRRLLGVYANLRPVRAWPGTETASPLRADIVAGTDLVIVRELTSGIYYGTPRGIEEEAPEPHAVNTMRYTRGEIERVAHTAFELARGRRRRVTSVDKANVLETSRLWRRTVEEVAREYPDVDLDHLFVDNCAMQLVLGPARFDVVLTENMFGDILSDEAAVLAGSIGMLPSASLGDRRATGTRAGLYEPVHGSAPDLAGRGTANPLGAIGSAAMMLQYSFGLDREAARIESAIQTVIAAGVVTADMHPAGRAATTAEVGSAVCRALS